MADQKTTIVIEGRDESSAAITQAANGLRGIAEIAAGGLLSAGFVKAADSLKNMALQASSVEAVRQSFNSLARDAGQDATKLLDALKAASRGTVIESELMKKANQAMLLMGGEVATKLPAFMEIARASAKATGMDVDYMFSSIVTGIGRASPRILDNLGMTVDLSETYDRFAESVGKAASELTKSEQVMALASEVERQGAQFIARMGESADTAGQKVKSFNVRMQELKDRVGKELIPALNSAMDVVSKLMGVLEAPGVSVAIAGFGKLAVTLAGVVGPLLMVNGGLKLLRATGFMDIAGLIANLGKYAAYSIVQLGAATGATTTLAAAQVGATLAAKAMWVAITGPVGIAAALIGGLVALLVVGKKSSDAMAESARKAAENLKAALSTPEENRSAEQLRLIAKEADLAGVRLQLLKDQRDRLMRESLDPGADDEIKRLNQQILELESRVRYLTGQWGNWNHALDMTREKWRSVGDAAKEALSIMGGGDLSVTIGMNLSPLGKDSFELQKYLREWKEAQDRATERNSRYLANEQATYAKSIADAENWLGRMGQTYGSMVAAKQSLIDQLAILDAQSAATAANAAAQYSAGTDVLEKSFEANQKALWEAGQKYIAELRAKGRSDDVKAAEADLKADIEQNAKDHEAKMKARKEQYAYEQELAKWNQNLQYAEAQLAYARSQKAAVDNMNAELAIYMMGKGANADAVIEAFGLQNNAAVQAAVKTAEYKDTFTLLMDQIGLSATQAAVTVAASANAQAAALAGAGGSVEYWLSVIAKLYETKPFQPEAGETINLDKYFQYVEPQKGKEFHSAVAESAASVTRDLATAIEGARASAESIAGFSMPADADARFKSLESFLEKAVNAVYNVMSRVGGKLINIRGSIRYITELSGAIQALNKALTSMVPARVLPDLSAWAADMDKMIGAAIGVVERAEASYGAGRIIKAGNLAKFISQLTGIADGGERSRMNGGGGAMNVNITVNGGNGSPSAIAQAVKGAVTQSAGVLRAARARGVA